MARTGEVVGRGGEKWLDWRCAVHTGLTGYFSDMTVGWEEKRGVEDDAWAAE